MKRLFLRRGLLPRLMMAALGLLPPLGWAIDLSQPAVRQFVERMETGHDFNPQRLRGWLEKAERRESILEAISRPAEKVLEWKRYRRIFLTEQRIAGGRAFLKAHEAAFTRAENHLGVSRQVVAAIIGVETRYGEHKGGYRVIDALATLGFHYPPRSRFFLGQLEEFFLLAREQGFDPLALKGSYAGAMGYGQFIPSSYRDFAIDFDDDGVADILDNPVDAIGSVAHYLARHDWVPDGPIAERLTGGEPAAELLSTRLPLKSTVGSLEAAGLALQADVPAETAADVVRLEGEKGPEYWVRYPNFYAITRYNHSNLYAMAVYQLAMALRAPSGD